MRMARIKLSGRGAVYHCISRVVGGQRLLGDLEKEKLRQMLWQQAAFCGLEIITYCLMANHVHLLTKPKSEESLYRMMQGLTLCYTQYSNRTHKRTGRLWESRYHSCIVDKDTYLWAVARYIEQNPLRAKVVKKPEDFPYSSARAHIPGVKDKTLTEPLFNEETRADYKKFVRGFIPDEE